MCMHVSNTIIEYTLFTNIDFNDLLYILLKVVINKGRNLALATYTIAHLLRAAW